MEKEVKAGENGGEEEEPEDIGKVDAEKTD